MMTLDYVGVGLILCPGRRCRSFHGGFVSVSAGHGEDEIAKSRLCKALYACWDSEAQCRVVPRAVPGRGECDYSHAALM